MNEQKTLHLGSLPHYKSLFQPTTFHTSNLQKLRTSKSTFQFEFHIGARHSQRHRAAQLSADTPFPARGTLRFTNTSLVYVRLTNTQLSPLQHYDLLSLYFLIHCDGSFIWGTKDIMGTNRPLPFGVNMGNAGF